MVAEAFCMAVFVMLVGLFVARLSAAIFSALGLIGLFITYLCDVHEERKANRTARKMVESAERAERERDENRKSVIL